MIFAFAFSILIALFWLKRFRKMDKYEKEPERLVYLTFFAGVVAIFLLAPALPGLVFLAVEGTLARPAEPGQQRQERAAPCPPFMIFIFL